VKLFESSWSALRCRAGGAVHGSLLGLDRANRVAPVVPLVLFACMIPTAWLACSQSTELHRSRCAAPVVSPAPAPDRRPHKRRVPPPLKRTIVSRQFLEFQSGTNGRLARISVVQPDIKTRRMQKAAQTSSLKRGQ
jgi:hypothetical protein